jgi:hypothetical protein
MTKTVAVPADEDHDELNMGGSTPRSSLPRSSARGAVHHIVMVTFDISVQGRRRVEKGRPGRSGVGDGEGFPRRLPERPGPTTSAERRDRLDYHPTGALRGPEAARTGNPPTSPGEIAFLPIAST